VRQRRVAALARVRGFRQENFVAVVTGAEAAPSPVNTMNRVARSALAASNAAPSSTYVCGRTAFIASGRLIVDPRRNAARLELQVFERHDASH
jgi:hypothetical protein